jgi:uncharacterized membrane protein
MPPPLLLIADARSPQERVHFTFLLQKPDVSTNPQTNECILLSLAVRSSVQNPTFRNTIRFNIQNKSNKITLESGGKISQLNVNFHPDNRRDILLRNIGLSAKYTVEVCTAVTMKNGAFWDVTPCVSCKNRCF